MRNPFLGQKNLQLNYNLFNIQNFHRISTQKAIVELIDNNDRTRPKQSCNRFNDETIMLEQSDIIDPKKL
jgi:hypothetical protein